MARRRPGRRVRGRSGRHRRPKVSSADEVLSLVSAMERHGAPDHTALWAMVETPRAMLHAEEIAAASARLTVLVMGTNDLAKELFAEQVPGRAPLLTGLSLALLAARVDGHGDPRRCLQRRPRHRRLPGRVPPGPRDGLRRQDPRPPRPGRGRQRRVRAQRAGRRGRARHRRRPGRTAAVLAWSRTRAGWWSPSTSTPPAVRWRWTRRSAPSDRRSGRDEVPRHETSCVIRGPLTGSDDRRERAFLDQPRRRQSRAACFPPLMWGSAGVSSGASRSA